MKHATACLMMLALTIPTVLFAEGHKMNDQNTEVLKTIETMTTAFQLGQIDAVMQSYEPTATVVFEPASPLSDPAQLREMFKGMSALKPKFSYDAEHEVIVSGDIALHIAPWAMTAKTPEGQPIEQSGLSVAILRRQSDGSWKMVIDNPHGSRLIANKT
ncbi:hypothetical protein NBRC116601_16170 [Cognatishimia sp. WU-CL00825]|uniref:YybH family protein n=1 Tax=Cognatishimia sp. WU-CL00825 TaxID=3127658 RepID=UPI003103069A